MATTKNPAVLWNTTQEIGKTGKEKARENIGLSGLDSDAVNNQYVTGISDDENGNLNVTRKRPSTSDLSDFSTEMAKKVDKTTEVNGHALSSDITLNASDISGVVRHDINNQDLNATAKNNAKTNIGLNSLAASSRTANSFVTHIENTNGILTAKYDRPSTSDLSDFSTEMAKKVDKTTEVNGHALSSSITLVASDISGVVRHDINNQNLDATAKNNAKTNIGLNSLAASSRTANSFVTHIENTNGILTAKYDRPSTSDISDFSTEMAKKVDKQSNATENNFASFDSTGNIQDSQKSASSFKAKTNGTTSQNVNASKTIDTITQDADGNITSVTYQDITTGTTQDPGIVQLSDTISTDTTTAATPNIVKTAKDRADAAYTLAASKQSPATTLDGYGITNAYTKDEVDNQIKNGTLSITVNGSTTTFSANQATDETITIPTHTHSNKSVLDGIDGNKVRQWDSAPVITDGITYGSQQAKVASGLTFAIEQVSENHKVFSTLPDDPSPSLKELGTLLPDPRLADVGQVPTLDANKKVVFSDLPVKSIADGTVPGTIKLNGNTDVSCNIVHEESNVTDWNTLVDTGLYAIKAQASNVQHSPESGKMPCITVNADNCILQMTYGDNMHWRWRSATGTWTEWFKAMKNDTEVLVKKGDAEANYNSILAILGAGLVPVIYKEDNVGSSSHVICYYHLSRMTDCIMWFSDEYNNQEYELTWWMDNGVHCACWSDASPIRQVTKEVRYNNTNDMNDYLATDNQYDTLVLRADYDRLASIGYRTYSGSTYAYIWKGIMVPYRYYICNISSSSIPGHVTSWETVDARITYNSSDAGTQYDTIYKVIHSISADIIPELKVGDKILTNFSRTILGSNYDSYTWIDDFVSPNVAYSLANINGVKKWTTYNITNSNNEISCTYSGNIISSSTTFSQILDLYKVYHANLKVTCTFTSQSVGGSAACWYTLDKVQYTNSTFSTIKAFVWKNITLGNNCGEITCDSTNGWSINN